MEARGWSDRWKRRAVREGARGCCATCIAIEGVCAAEVTGVLWPMCRKCMSRIRKYPADMVSAVMSACVTITMIARRSGFTIKHEDVAGELPSEHARAEALGFLVSE